MSMAVSTRSFRTGSGFPGFSTGALAAVALLGAPGCAFIPETVALDSLTISAPRKGGRGREVIVFPAVDARPYPAGCGAKRNGWGVATARIKCKPEPKDWLGSLVLTGLHQAGFRIVTTQTANSPDPLRLRLTLKQLFLDMQANDEPAVGTLSADVHVLIQAETDSGLVADRSFFVAKRQNVFDGYYYNRPDKTDPSVVRAHVMDDATRDLAAAIVNAVLILADRFPTIGTVPGSASRPSPAVACLATETQR